MRNSFSRSDLSMMPMRVLRLPKCAIDCRYHDSRNRDYPHECGMTTVRSRCDRHPPAERRFAIRFPGYDERVPRFSTRKENFLADRAQKPAPAAAGYCGKPLWQTGLGPGLRVRLAQTPDDCFSLCGFDAAQVAVTARKRAGAQIHPPQSGRYGLNRGEPPPLRGKGFPLTPLGVN